MCKVRTAKYSKIDIGVSSEWNIAKLFPLTRSIWIFILLKYKISRTTVYITGTLDYVIYLEWHIFGIGQWFAYLSKVNFWFEKKRLTQTTKRNLVPALMSFAFVWFVCSPFVWWIRGRWLETIGFRLPTKIIRKLFIDKCGFVIFPLLLCVRRESVRRPSPAWHSTMNANNALIQLLWHDYYDCCFCCIFVYRLHCIGQSSLHGTAIVNERGTKQTITF